MELVENSEPCKDCGVVFMREKKRGRPPTRCLDCRALFEAAQLAGETAARTVPAVSIQQGETERIFDGPKNKLKGDRADKPQGSEAQCPLCWRIFTSDSAAEAHKVYPKEDQLILCKDPATIGMVPRSRRNLPIWTRPTDRVFIER